jgi:hypothetical protein
MKNNYIGIGAYCQTAAQIRRCTGSQDSGLFDWLVSPDQAFNFIQKEDAGFLESGNWEIVNNPENVGIRVLDKYSGLLFQHEFPLLDSGGIDPDKVESHLPIAKKKFLYLKAKTLQSIRSGDNCVLVRAEDGLITRDDTIRRVEEIREVFKPINHRVKVILASATFEAEFQHPEFLAIKMQPAQEWYGDYASWDRLFSLSEQLINP